MRSTLDIIVDVKDNVDVDKEELRLALLVLDSINFFNHKRMKNLLSGGLIAECTKKRDFPGACADLGVSVPEYDALRMDPVKYLGASNIPGTSEYTYIHSTIKKLYKSFMESTL